MRKTETGWITDVGWRIDRILGATQVRHVCKKNTAPISCQYNLTRSCYVCPNCHAQITPDEIDAKLGQ